ncbi:MAG TPA: hypothetical protein VFT98_16170 [Myxococcota bacterium]|nr:hypothetical protein [Myxococcota bacterium]
MSAPRVSPDGKYAFFDQMTWPVPCGASHDPAWRAVYATPTRSDLTYLASVYHAYTALICDPQRKRARVVRRVRDAMCAVERAKARP